MPRRKLLLADDSITIQKVVNLTFADEGIDVVAVSDGDAALDKLREDSPDIVLADVNMPGLTGYEICAEVKGREFADQVPVVLLVGSFEPFDEDEADRVGADGYLTKPFQSISQLVTKVSELLGVSSEDQAQFEDTAEIEPQEPDDLTASMDSVSVEPATPSFPNPFEGFVSKHEGHESLVGEPEVEPVEPQISEFRDADEFEMSEAFSDDESIEEVEPAAADDTRIEEVSEDFLKTQPLTKSDLQEISVDVESVEVVEEESEQSDAYEASEIKSPFSFESAGEEAETGEDTPVFRVESTDEFEPQTQFGSLEESGEKDSPGMDSVVDFGSWEPEVSAPESELPEIMVPEESEPEVEIPEDIMTDVSAPESELPEFMVPEESAPEVEIPADMMTEVSAPEVEIPEENMMTSFSAPESETPESVPYSDAGAGGEFDAELPQPEGVSVLDLDDVNLLELPPVDDDADEEYEVEVQPFREYPAVTKDFDFVAESSETTETPSPQEIEQLEPAKAESVSEAIPPEMSEEESAQVTETGDDTPSKAMVEAITRQVIEALSEKAIREIAWEVVPNMADLIIKKMAEEKMKD